MTDVVVPATGYVIISASPDFSCPDSRRYYRDKGIMQGKTVIYGDIISAEERRAMKKGFAGKLANLVWRRDKTLFAPDESCAAVFVDLDDPRFANPEFLVSLATAGEQVRVIGKSDRNDIQDTIKVSKLGVAEVLTSEQCLTRLHDLLNEVEEIATASEHRDTRYTIDALIGSSPQIKEIRKTIRLLAEVDFPSALILGETGSGKSLVSRILHNTGLRGKHNLVEVNCSAIPDELFESELFGHVKGAFTDAKNEKTGLFEFAQEGTLFLDEVGNLSPSAQAKLLKVLEDKKLRKVGSVEEKDISVRVVAATNVDLHEAIRAGQFREDLYFRLNLLTIEIPPLRQRPEDIRDLIEYYLNQFAVLYNKGTIRFSENAIEDMTAYAWPGNIRELCNVVERAVLLTHRDEITAKDIRSALKRGRITAAERRQLTIELPPQGVSLEDVQAQVIKRVLDMFNWNKTEAARYLQISRPRLRRIIQAAGLEQNRRRP
ncbi:MAG: sigma-54-dependent Fis family transcriptional regulator [Candidatus Zixiibacteriota bacterium]|nr:MAG: sigma-54-dependent Fis family transcriptional regulator [candidate division Zixibacteria bacterium]